MTIKTRKPTGIIPTPSVLVSGEEKTGKTTLALALSASDKVGDTYVIEVGEGAADVYSELGPYQIVEHDGTLSGLSALVDNIRELPVDPEKPTVVIIDSTSNIWDACKDEAGVIASKRGSKDKNGDVIISMDLWNRAARRFYNVIGPLVDWPGIVILTARGRYTAEVNGGRPTGGQTWSTDCHKLIGNYVDCVLRLEKPHTLLLEGAWSPNIGKLDLPRRKADGLIDLTGKTMEEIIFDIIGAGTAEERNSARMQSRDVTKIVDAKKELYAVVLESVDGDKDAAKEKAGEVWEGSGLETEGDDFVETAALNTLIESIASDG